MFCKNCGKQLDDGTKFCRFCGTRIELNQGFNQQNAGFNPGQGFNQPDTEFNPNQGVNNNPPDMNFGQMPGNGSIPPVKPPKKGLKKIIIAAATAVAVGAAAFAAPGILTKLASPEKYLEKVASAKIKTFANSLSSLSESTENLCSGNKGAAEELTVTIDDSVWKLADNDEAEQALSWIDSVGLTCNVNPDDSAMGINMGIKLNGKEITNAEIVMDANEKAMYLSLPEFNSKAIRADFRDMDIPDMDFNVYKQLAEILPDKTLIDKLANNYLTGLVKNAGKVSKSKGTAAANGVSKKITCLDIVITDKTLKNAVVDTLTKLKKDKDIEKYINQLAQSGAIPYIDGSVYSEFVSQIDDVLEELQSTEVSDEKLMTAKVWVDKNEMIGIEIGDVDDNVKFKYISLVDRKNFGTEISCTSYGTEVFSVKGAGIADGKKRTGKYDIAIQGMQIASISAEGMEYVDDKGLSGIFTIKPNSVLLNNIPSQYDIFSDPSLAVILAHGNKESKIGLAVLNGETKLISLDANVKETDKQSIEKPSSYVDADDTYAMEEWTGSLNMNSIITKLKDAGMPEYISGLLEQSMTF